MLNEFLSADNGWRKKNNRQTISPIPGNSTKSARTLQPITHSRISTCISMIMAAYIFIFVCFLLQSSNEQRTTKKKNETLSIPIICVSKGFCASCTKGFESRIEKFHGLESYRPTKPVSLHPQLQIPATEHNADSRRLLRLRSNRP